MASTASGSGTLGSPSASENTAGGSSEQTTEQRPQAGPLPVKAPRLVGEIGYSESISHLQNVDSGDRHDDEMDSTEGLNAAEADARNGRHPADTSRVDLTSQSTAPLPPPLSSSPSSRQSPTGPNGSTTTVNTTAKHSTFSLHCLSSQIRTKKYHGITMKTWIRVGTLCFILCGLVVAWVFAALHLSKSPIASGGMVQNRTTSAIFIHVAFGIIALLILVFFERAIFQLRAERYAHKHPGGILPSHFHSRGMHTSNAASNGIGLAPWNRPPLPTYAAALGVRGTGDVEDAIIAAPPPPEYGNIRGSTLLLSNFLRNSRTSNRSHASVNRADTQRRASVLSTQSAPISYDEVEHQSDVERARILEEALAKLEEASGSRRNA